MDGPGAGPTGEGGDAVPPAHDELDAVVRRALAGGATPRAAERALREVPGVTVARLRPGMVKTQPPILELDVELAPPGRRVVRRVYDLVAEADGGARVVDSHPA